jgi:hypothetical protein
MFLIHFSDTETTEHLDFLVTKVMAAAYSLYISKEDNNDTKFCDQNKEHDRGIVSPTCSMIRTHESMALHTSQLRSLSSIVWFKSGLCEFEVSA